MTTELALCCMYWLFEILISLDVYLAQPVCSGEGLKLSTGQGALSSPKIGGGGGGGVEGVGWEWEEGRKWEFELIF